MSSTEESVHSQSQSEEEFAQNEEGALCYPVSAGSLKKGMHVLAKDEFPCKIIEVTTSKTGKHGHAKAHITCVDIFTDKKYELNESTSHRLMCPNVTKEDFQLIDVDEEGNVTYMEKNGDFNTSIKLDTSSELFESIRKDLNDGNSDILVSICSAMGHSAILSYRKE